MPTDSNFFLDSFHDHSTNKILLCNHIPQSNRSTILKDILSVLSITAVTQEIAGRWASVAHRTTHHQAPVTQLLITLTELHLSFLPCVHSSYHIHRQRQEKSLENLWHGIC
jgi:hypothetical protein